jgi:hypothetical protein
MTPSFVPFSGLFAAELHGSAKLGGVLAAFLARYRLWGALFRAENPQPTVRSTPTAPDVHPHGNSSTSQAFWRAVSGDPTVSASRFGPKQVAQYVKFQIETLSALGLNLAHTGAFT